MTTTDITRQDLIDFVAGELRDGDVCVSMDCGDIASFPSEVIERRLARFDHEVTR